MGWYKESYRHYLAGKGIKTKKYAAHKVGSKMSRINDQLKKYELDKIEGYRPVERFREKISAGGDHIATNEEVLEQINKDISMYEKTIEDTKKLEAEGKLEKPVTWEDHYEVPVERVEALRRMKYNVEMKIKANADKKKDTELGKYMFDKDARRGSKKYMMAKWGYPKEKEEFMKKFEDDAKNSVAVFIHNTDARNSGSSRYRLSEVRAKYKGQINALKRLNLISPSEQQKLDSVLDSALDPGRNHIENLREQRNVGKSDYSKYQEKAGIYTPGGKK